MQKHLRSHRAMSGDEFGQAIAYLVFRDPACLSNHASRFAAVGIFSLELRQAWRQEPFE
jgi:hypothetical protein